MLVASGGQERLPHQPRLCSGCRSSRVKSTTMPGWSGSSYDIDGNLEYETFTDGTGDKMHIRM